jgi:hypothetical protein
MIRGYNGWKNELAITTVNNGEADGTSQTNGEINRT